MLFVQRTRQFPLFCYYSIKSVVTILINSLLALTFVVQFISTVFVYFWGGSSDIPVLRLF